jgi:hypothetical protein
MACTIHRGLPPNCALKRGTLISGVTKHDDSDPMASAANELEDWLTKSIADRNRGVTGQSQQSTPTTPKPNEPT